MTPELRWLVYTALLAGSLWAPYVVGVNVTDFPGKGDLFERPPDPSGMPAWVHRSLRAHQNLLEQLLPYAVVVLAGAIAGVSTPMTRILPMAFFLVRAVHALGMITGLARFPVRPMLYVSGWVILLLHAWQVCAA